jgi:hypothetical protein
MLGGSTSGNNSAPSLSRTLTARHFRDTNGTTSSLQEWAWRMSSAQMPLASGVSTCAPLSISVKDTSGQKFSCLDAACKGVSSM